MSEMEKRLHNFLNSRSLPINSVKLTPDASTREYFRIKWTDSTAIACVYPEPFIAAEQSYLDVTALFEKAGLPVARIFDFDEHLGVIIQEDFGDTVLRGILVNSDERERNALIDKAISIIPRIQAATPLAFQSGSIASKLKFDKEKLMWELDFFKTHYFTTLKKRPLNEAENESLTADFTALSEYLESKATVLCHRDFHAANLMVAGDNELKIIDHQDARMGSIAYDLVSLLLDRINDVPEKLWVESKCRYFLELREDAGLELIDHDDFMFEFSMQAIQRCLKAIGTFSFQASNRGKDHFLPFIGPMFMIVNEILKQIELFPALADMVSREANEN